MIMVIFGLSALALAAVLAAVRANRPFARNRRLMRKRDWQHRAVGAAAAAELVWAGHREGAYLWGVGAAGSSDCGGCGGGD